MMQGIGALSEIDYGDVRTVKGILRNWNTLEQLNILGNRDATCILADLKAAFGVDPAGARREEYMDLASRRNKNVLSETQFISVVFVLILGYSQAEVSFIFQLSQQAVSLGIAAGAEKIAGFLCQKEGKCASGQKTKQIPG